MKYLVDVGMKNRGNSLNLGRAKDIVLEQVQNLVYFGTYWYIFQN